MYLRYFKVCFILNDLIQSFILMCKSILGKEKLKVSDSPLFQSTMSVTL